MNAAKKRPLYDSTEKPADRSDGRFGVNDVLTRAQAAMLQRRQPVKKAA